MSKAIFMLAFLLSAHALFAQKVGLVLSGGGAKGATHIGVIKALEENNVPIDYITGTSMGAIIGSLYAMGYSPDEMLELLLSDEFGYWQTGAVESEYVYFFMKPEDTPDIAHFTVSISDSLQFRTTLFPQSLVNPIQMNQALMSLFAQATARASWNFDNLFVPFRCVASDIYNKKAIVFRNGDLGDAVRASMSFPLVFKPLWKDSVPLFDGGIFDNFPVNPMKEAFQPDFIIGSAVAGTQNRPSENIYYQLETMVMQKPDFDIPEDEGIVFKFDYPNVSLLEFARAKELMDIGYEQTLAWIDSLKRHVPREVSAGEVAIRREAYRASLPPLVFRNIHITGVNESQASYIRAQLQRDVDDVFTMEEFRRAYFKMLTYSKIKEIVPHALYNYRDRTFDLYLDVTMSDDLLVGFGGNVSSHQANQLFLSIGYQNISSFASDLSANFHVGNSYDGVMLSSRFYLQTLLPTYIHAQGVFSNKKYSESQFLFYEDVVPSIIKQKELYMSLKFGFPYKGRAKAETGLSYGKLSDYYLQTANMSITNAIFEHSWYNILNVFARVERNTLDYKLYPTAGRRWRLSATYATGTENYRPRAGSRLNEFTGRAHHWWTVKGDWQRYHAFNKSLSLGFSAEAVLSNKPLLDNYTASILQAPAFTPTPHSHIVFNESFRANQYLAAGLSPIFRLNRIAHLRADLFGFVPLQEIKRETPPPTAGQPDDYEPYKGDWLSTYRLMGEVSLVIQLPFASISVYTNGYSRPKNNFNFGVNIGYLLFPPRMLD
jgi:NTE family protein